MKLNKLWYLQPCILVDLIPHGRQNCLNDEHGIVGDALSHWDILISRQSISEQLQQTTEYIIEALYEDL